MKPLSGSIFTRSAFLLFLFVGAAHAADHGDPILVVDEASASVILVEPLATTQQLLWSGLPLVAPTDAVLEVDGTLLIADPGADAIFRFDWVAGIEPTPFITSGSATCWLLRLDAKEVLASGPDGLISIDTATGDQTPLQTAVVNPFDLDLLPNGEILVADPGAAQLTSVNRVTWVGTAFSEGSTNCWIAVDPAGQIAAAGPDGVFLVPAQGGDPVLISSGGFLSDPSAVAFGGHGDIYVANRGVVGAGPASGAAIVKVDPVTGDQTVVASGGFLQAPSAIIVLEGDAPELPTLPHFGRVVLVVLLLGSALAWAVRRSRRRAPAAR